MVKLVFKMIPALIVFEACGSDESSEISATGTIEATEVTVSAQAGGVVMQLRADEASSVQVGDTLAVIDATDWMYQLQQAEGNLAATEAQYKLALRAVREEDLIQAETNYKSAETDLKRMQELAPLGSVSQKQLEDARTRFTLAQQAYEKLKRGSRREEIDMARARRDQAEGQALAIRKKVSDCTVTAPLSGTVTKRFIEKGELAGQGASLFRIANLAEMNLMIYVSETELPRIKVGQSAKVRVDAFEKRNFEGKVIFISPTAEFTPKNIQTKDERVKLVFGVKVRVLNPEGALKSGIPADVILHGETAQ